MTMGSQSIATSFEMYKALYWQSINDTDTFWGNNARELLSWFIPFTSTRNGSFSRDNIAWFPDGYLNACYNCVDRHAFAHPDKVAIIYEPDDPVDESTPTSKLPPSPLKLTYSELLKQVCQLANSFKYKFGLQKGDCVAIYMPMCPELVVTMLACTRLGLIHSVIFAGFQPAPLQARINDGNCKLVVTADQGRRNGKSIELKRIVDEAIKNCPCVKNVLMFKRTGDPSIPFNPSMDVWWHEELKHRRSYCAPVIINSEDPLFILYTSGSTGKPKGIIHSTGGYLLGAAMAVKHSWDAKEGDIYGCMADVGWITGHTHVVYGPLCLGLSTVLFESTPIYPTPSRYWEVISKYSITQFFTSPTALRTLMRLGDKYINNFDLKSLRVIGSAGEPLNEAAWKWFHEKVGHGRCPIIDNYWQTESGSNLIAPLPGVFGNNSYAKPGSAGFPFYGIELAIIDPVTLHEYDSTQECTGMLAIKRSWPSIARTIHGDHTRFYNTYFGQAKGYYVTGDEATRDKDGYYWIKGRIDDVINVAGHRLTTSEIETALMSHHKCAEAAVIGIPDEVKGQAICAFVVKKSEYPETDEEIMKEMATHIARTISPIARPQVIYIVPELPKTRSGKIMRRVLRKIKAREFNVTIGRNKKLVYEGLGDLTTMQDKSIIPILIELICGEKDTTKSKL